MMGEEWRYGVAHLHHVSRRGKREYELVWKGLKSRAFAYRESSGQTVMELDS